MNPNSIRHRRRVIALELVKLEKMGISDALALEAPVAPVGHGFNYETHNAPAYKYNSATFVDPYCTQIHSFSKIAKSAAKLLMTEQIFPAIFREGGDITTPFRVEGIELQQICRRQVNHPRECFIFPIVEDCNWEIIFTDIIGLCSTTVT